MVQTQVGWVTGATRGVGKGIALALADRGWTLFLTGRTETGPHSLAAVGAEVEARGGAAVLCPCDHRHDEQVRAVVRRIEVERGHLDLLVNNVFAIPAEPIWGKPFWEQPLAHWDAMHEVGLRSHFVASTLAAPLLLAAVSARAPRHPLIVHVSSFAGAGYQLAVSYGVGKAGVDRMARDMAHELKSHEVAVVSLWPGIVRTEWVLAQSELPFPTAVTESPEFSGRAVAHLAEDPQIMERTGAVCVVAELAESYGFDDVDGRRPPSLRGAR